LTLYIVLSGGVFVALFFIHWKHNHSSYPQQYAKWDRSFICERCGAISQQTVKDGMGS
jgi:hypothetical protein